jgi:hypothetical protein
VRASSFPFCGVATVVLPQKSAFADFLATGYFGSFAQADWEWWLVL